MCLKYNRFLFMVFFYVVMFEAILNKNKTVCHFYNSNIDTTILYEFLILITSRNILNDFR